MFLVIFLFVIPVWSDLLPPENVQVDRGVLSWTTVNGQEDATFTVSQRESLRSVMPWTVLSSCSQTNVTTCDVTSITKGGGPECVQLTVREQKRGQSSVAASACSKQNGSCTPEVKLLVAPGTIIVELDRSHPLIEKHGGVIKYRVYFGEEGAPLEPLKEDHHASLELPELKRGQSYCVSVQFIHFYKPVGLPRCAVCKRVPDKEADVATVVGAVLGGLAFLTALFVYVLLFQQKRIKSMLQQKYHIHDVIPDSPLGFSQPNTPVEENLDTISCILSPDGRDFFSTL